LYGYTSWFLTLREEHTRVAGRIYGPKREEVTKGMEETT